MIFLNIELFNKLKQEAVDGKQNALPAHEIEHKLIGIRDDQQGTVTTGHIFTSSKSHYVTKMPNTMLDPDINYALEAKPQRMASLQSTRTFDPSTEYQAWEEDKELTQYLNQPQIYPKVVEAIENSPKMSSPSMRHHKDDPIFYTENGQNINAEEEF